MRSRCKTFRALVIVFLVLFTFSVWSEDRAFSSESGFALILRGGDGVEPRVGFDELRKLPRLSVRAKDEKGKESVWKGVPLYELLKVTGVKLGEAIRGKALANYLLVEAADGYQVVFTLPEMDPAFTDLTFLLADRRDGQPMGEYEGSLRMVVPHEKRHARWVRQVTAISIRCP